MSIVKLLFSFESRTRRLHYWLFNLALAVLEVAAFVILTPSLFDGAAPSTPPLSLTLLSLLLLYPATAVTVKRTNDINWSPVWAYGLAAGSAAYTVFEAFGMVSSAGVTSYVFGGSFLLLVIAAIVIGCIRSVDSENAHGASPCAVAA